MAEAVGVRVGVSVTVGDGVREGVRVMVGVGVMVGVAVAVAVGVTVLVGVGVGSSSNAKLHPANTSTTITQSVRCHMRYFRSSRWTRHVNLLVAVFRPLNIVYESFGCFLST